MYPVVVLSSWILASILENVSRSATYTSEILIKRFLLYSGPNSSSIKYTPLVRIFALTQITPVGELVAVVNDSTHKIVVIFTRDAIERFESRYSQRLTFESVRTLVILRQANLRFINGKVAPFCNRALGGISKAYLKGISMLYLEVSEVEFFSRDQHTVSLGSENMLSFVYGEPEYADLFGAALEQKASLHTDTSDAPGPTLSHDCDLAEDYDGIVSEYEEDESMELSLRSNTTGNYTEV